MYVQLCTPKRMMLQLVDNINEIIENYFSFYSFCHVFQEIVVIIQTLKFVINSKHGKDLDSEHHLERLLTMHEPRHTSSYSLNACTLGLLHIRSTALVGEQGQVFCYILHMWQDRLVHILSITALVGEQGQVNSLLHLWEYCDS